MAIERLVIQSLRNLSAVDLSLGRRVNFFYGSNGSGKTSVLEALSLLSHGRSFRSHLVRPIIQHNEPKLTVFATIRSGERSIPLGIERSRTKPPIIKLDGQIVQSAADLAYSLPLLLLDSQSFQLLEGGPKERRQLLDWLVFHVEPGFIDTWRRFQRCLKQRNSMLRRDRITPAEIAVWDHELASLGNSIHLYRVEVFKAYKLALRALLGQPGFSDRIANIDVEYERGWPEDTSLETALQDNIERDIRSGYSHVGPQRAELKITVNGHKAAEVLSRGQQKIVVSGLKLAQAHTLKEQTDKISAFLVDDLPAELDEYHQGRLAEWLNRLESQVFVTGVDRAELLKAWPMDPGETLFLFHVEHGQVRPVTI